MKRTNRGFKIYSEFSDTYGNRITVQESSAACAPRCWLFSKFPNGEDAKEHLGSLIAASPHLSPAQARRLAKALLKFADEQAPEVSPDE